MTATIEQYTLRDDAPTATVHPYRGRGTGHKGCAACGLIQADPAHDLADVIPADMRAHDRWVMWGATKRPLRMDGRPASVTNPADWGCWAQAARRGKRGFVLGAGIGCIDLDHCLDDAGRMSPDVARYIRPGTYVEVSPSGTGLHVFGWLAEAPGRRRVLANGIGVEVYSMGRYITVTGDVWGGAPARLADLAGVV